jgi:GT2 family glycosyltransferase
LERIKVGAVFVNFRRPDLLLRAVTSLETTHHWRLFIIDNATLKLPSLAAAWNRGIEAAVAWGAERILVSNDDVLFHPCTLDHLVERAILKDYGFLCPTDVAKEQGLGPAGLASLPPPSDGVDRFEANYSCFMLSPSLYDEIGPFDEGFTPAYFEDTDYNLRLGLAWRPGMTTTYAPFFHYGGASGGIPPGVRDDNRQRFIAKWKDSVPWAEAFASTGGLMSDGG